MVVQGTGKEVLSNTINKAYETGKIAKDFKNCAMIPILKKKRSKCKEYRTIS